jgi:hypothetical protein
MDGVNKIGTVGTPAPLVGTVMLADGRCVGWVADDVPLDKGDDCIGLLVPSLFIGVINGTIVVHTGATRTNFVGVLDSSDIG